MAENYIKNLNGNYVSFLLAMNTISRLDPRHIDQHENPQEKHNVPNQQFQIVIPHEIPHNVTSQQYPNPKSKKKRHRNSSLPQKTQSDALKSNHSQKKHSNYLFTIHVLTLTTSMTTSYNTANILNKNNKISRLPKTSTSSQLATINKKI